MESQDWHLAQVQFVVSMQNAFVVHKDDESLGQRNSSSPTGLSIGPSDHEVGTLGPKPSHRGAQDQRTLSSPKLTWLR